MEAFFVVVLALVMLGVGAAALLFTHRLGVLSARDDITGSAYSRRPGSPREGRRSAFAWGGTPGRER